MPRTLASLSLPSRIGTLPHYRYITLLLIPFDSTSFYSCSPSLTKYHTRLLTLKGDAAGSWYETRVGTQEQSMDVEREIVSLEARLIEVPQWEARLVEVAKELGVSVVMPKVNV